MRQLLLAGLSHPTALRLVNSALMVKSRDESLATLDVATLDLFTGRADFYKAGAAPTFIVRGQRVEPVVQSSLPAGILRGVEFEHSSLRLEDGDYVVMVSDGVTGPGVEWVKEELASLKSGSARELSEALAKAARGIRSEKRDDDITVLTARLVARH
jgi:stage II sporulation protein E